MKRVLLNGLLLCLTVSGIVTSNVQADGMMFPFGLDLGFLQVDYHRVHVEIDGSFAHTRVKQRFVNPFSEPIQARYIFPLPPEAAIRDFILEIDGTPRVAERLSVEESQLYFQGIILSLQAPSLLQFWGWETFSVMLDIPALGNTEMLLEYEEMLASQDDLFRYFYTLGTERYSAMPLSEVEVIVDIKGEDGVSAIYSPNHIVSTNRIAKNHMRAIYRAENVLPQEHFELYFSRTEQPFGASLLTTTVDEKDGWGHFLLLLSPSSILERNEAAPKEIIFVIDRSGSMAGEKIEQAKEALQFILAQLNEKDQFAVVSFDDWIESPTRSLQPVSPETIRQARMYIEELSARGDTDIESALSFGLDMFEPQRKSATASQTIVFLTDGIPTAGVTEEKSIIRRIQNANERIGANIHVFGVGFDVNTHLLDQLAAMNHGSVIYVQEGEHLETALTGFYGQIEYPMLTDLELTFHGMQVHDVYPKQLPDLFAGSNVAVVGRYRSAGTGDMAVRLEGLRAGERWSHSYPFSISEDSNTSFVGRLWATRRIGDLLDELRVEGSSDTLVSEIQSLGLEFGIVTPYTTDLIYAQSSGTASDTYLQLYSQDLDNDGQLDLNQASGMATVGARFQNLAYQQTTQANMAAGSNVVNIQGVNVAQIGKYAYALGLADAVNLGITGEPDERWLVERVDRFIEFASDDYFKLAEDPAANSYLQAGPNVVFEHNGSLIAVTTDPVQSEKTSTVDPTGLWDWLWLLLGGMLLSF
jgi:Ca-activated chloride channel family protein